MKYEAILQYLYERTPSFQDIGGAAYKPGLDRTFALDEALKCPHRNYRIIHVAGTNGKGSVSHLLATILRASKYKVGLYTSPHLTDFCERIRVNGKKIPRQYVVDFVESHRMLIESINPSFFELTSAMAFDYFKHKKVDFAIVETGLGGRLDSTNIVTPIMSIITNISMDHMQFLGDTPERIAEEKAGIIKPYRPVVIGNASNPNVRQVFINKAKLLRAQIYFASDEAPLRSAQLMPDGKWLFDSKDFGEIKGELAGSFQKENAQTVLTAIRALKEQGIKLHPNAIVNGFAKVVEATGLMGRWQTIQNDPTVICDTGHNTGAWENLRQLLNEAFEHHPHLHLVIGMASDKDVDSVLNMMPKQASYYFTQASVKRALSEEELARKALKHGLYGTTYPTVREAVRAATEEARNDDLIFIGGSTFVVADALPLFPTIQRK
ncbi:folylpolyglutamate synthase/dihydrofolate synthase family protein [Tannerella sp.]|uniref:bifunctional folylpolyglutamate synthase/dihydrofolate synthase n=1 Tax=Tannerella sp. TaxID=2382127 RepID=UPI0026DAEF41|nr:folylpolyglutamate synthase/dihydrofolate synthase family protein [Tannerella sp.]MDO4704071.1 folylpolyglutamate synthase/dihydrofolate synthase family protein [Tannerella sp.]